VGGVLAAVVALARVAHSVATRGSSGLFNDFYDYWAAGVLLNRGQDPYHIGALHTVQRAAGLQVETGGGYSYPVFFAHLLRPLALIAAPQAAFIFMGLSLIALCGAIALLLGSIPRVSWPVALTGGAAAGLFPPVIGSLYFGQANLLVLLLLAVAYRCAAPGPMLGLASAIKLYPVTGLLAAVTERPPRLLQHVPSASAGWSMSRRSASPTTRAAGSSSPRSPAGWIFPRTRHLLDQRVDQRLAQPARDCLDLDQAALARAAG